MGGESVARATENRTDVSAASTVRSFAMLLRNDPIMTAVPSAGLAGESSPRRRRVPLSVKGVAREVYIWPHLSFSSSKRCPGHAASVSDTVGIDQVKHLLAGDHPGRTISLVPRVADREPSTHRVAGRTMAPRKRLTKNP